MLLKSEGKENAFAVKMHLEKSTYKWTPVVQTHVVQRSTAFITSITRRTTSVKF